MVSGRLANNGFPGHHLDASGGQRFGAVYCTKLAYAAKGGQQTALPRGDGSVVCFNSALEVAPGVAVVAMDDLDTVGDLDRNLADLFGVFRKTPLAPSVADSLEHGDKCGGSGEEDFAVHSVLDQRWVVLQRGAEEVVAGNEEDHHLRGGLELAPVLLAAELIDVFTDLLSVAVQRIA